LVNEIKEHDEPILKHLKKIVATNLEGDNFQLEFTFSDNEFFTNLVLKKTFHMKDD